MDEFLKEIKGNEFVKKLWEIENFKNTIFIQFKQKNIYSDFFLALSGFKIHILAKKEDGLRIIKLIIPELVEETYLPSFKFVDLRNSLYNKKLVTIYFGHPAHSFSKEAELMRGLVKKLDKLLWDNNLGCRGTIEGDRKVPDTKSGCLFYRIDRDEKGRYLKPGKVDIFSSSRNPFFKDKGKSKFSFYYEFLKDKNQEFLKIFKKYVNKIRKDEKKEITVKGNLLIGFKSREDAFAFFKVFNQRNGEPRAFFHLSKNEKAEVKSGNRSIVVQQYSAKGEKFELRISGAEKKVDFVIEVLEENKIRIINKTDNVIYYK